VIRSSAARRLPTPVVDLQCLNLPALAVCTLLSGSVFVEMVRLVLAL